MRNSLLPHHTQDGTRRTPAGGRGWDPGRVSAGRSGGCGAQGQGQGRRGQLIPTAESCGHALRKCMTGHRNACLGTQASKAGAVAHSGLTRGGRRATNVACLLEYGTRRAAGTLPPIPALACTRHAAARSSCRPPRRRCLLPLRWLQRCRADVTGKAAHGQPCRPLLCLRCSILRGPCQQHLPLGGLLAACWGIPGPSRACRLKAPHRRELGRRVLHAPAAHHHALGAVADRCMQQEAATAGPAGAKQLSSEAQPAPRAETRHAVISGQQVALGRAAGKRNRRRAGPAAGS